MGTSAAARGQENVNRLRRGLAFKARRLVYHSTLGARVMKKKKKVAAVLSAWDSTSWERERVLY